MNNITDRHSAPPSITPNPGRRIRGRPGQTASRLTRTPRDVAADKARAGSTASSPSLVEWHVMTEPEHTLAWAQLRAWTTWLIGRYRLALEDRLPVCWPQHPELVEELWALHAWRTEAYGPDGTGQSAVYWHQALITLLNHTSTWWAAGCRAGHTTTSNDIDPEHAEAWASGDPLTGIPHVMRPIASIASDPATEPGVITMPELNVLTAAQMQALTEAGLAHPRHETIAAFTYYDGSWWAYASKQEPDADPVWFRADDVDLACDPTFYPQPTAAD